MNSRERFLAALRRQMPDRVPRTDGFPWPETLQRWQAEGLAKDQTIHDILDLDRIGGAHFPVNIGYPARLLQETDDYKIEVDANGVTVQSWKKNYATPLEKEFAIKSFDDWKKYRENLDVRRFPADAAKIEASRQARAAGQFHYLTIDEPVWFALRLLGHDHCLEFMLLEPEFIEDIAARITHVALELAEGALAAGGQFDALWLWSDLCYKNGMLYAPAVHRRLFQKYHRRIKEWARRHDLPIIYHCDGDVREFIPLLIEAGIDCIQPLEARCGNDVRVYKREYGRDIALFGNISMDVMARGDRREIEQEVVSKIETAKAGGGYIHHSDHSVPPTVSWATYCYWQALARKHGGN